MRIDRRDRPWIALTVASFLAGLAVSWQRWGSPLVDCGREMQQPLRILRGERLYGDIAHFYGPFSPYFDALLFRIFGPSLDVLYANGILTAVLILGLVYWLARQVMDRASATAATLTVLWLCAFKQSGNYFLPYAFAAVHGCALSLAALVFTVRFLQSGRQALLLASALLTGLALLAKTEMGVAAAAGGTVAAAMATPLGPRPALRRLVLFLLPAAALTAGIYAWIGSRVGWDVLVRDSYLFPRHLPEAMVFFNKRMFGFDHPAQSLLQMGVVALRLATLATLVAVVSVRLSHRGRAMEPGLRERLRRLTLLLGVLLGAVLVTLPGAEADMGPYLAVPILLAALVGLALRRYVRHRQRTGRSHLPAAVMLTLAVFALASLARTLLRVRSGGAYSSYLLPASVILFTYGWTCWLPRAVRPLGARHVARRIGLGLLFAWVVGTAAVSAYRYRVNHTHPIRTPRGAMVTLPDLGRAWEEAMRFIESETRSGDPVAVLPEGTTLNFFTGRSNPLPEEITTPGLLNEDRAIRRLEETGTRLVLITNRPTVEFGRRVFGRDYNRRFMQWLERRFEVCGVFGPSHDPRLELGGGTFFIRAYCRR